MRMPAQAEVKRGPTMRIAYVNTDAGVPPFGQKGCSVHVQEVIRGFLAKGHAVDLFTTVLGGQAPPGLEAVRVVQLPSIPKADRALREQAALAANTQVRATLQREGPYSMVYERCALWSFAGMEYAQAAGVPGVLEVNAPLVDEQAAHRGLVDRPAAEQAALRTFSAARILAAVSEEVADYLERYPQARGRVRVVPNGVDVARFEPGLEPALAAAPGTFTVGFVGTLKPWHGLPVLADAFLELRKQVPNVRLLIVGDGPERSALEARLRARGADPATILTGAVAPAQIPGLLASMNVAVAPYPQTSTFYFSPLKVYEYMAAALPVVASRIGQLSGLIEDNLNGLLCSPGNAGELAQALARLNREPALRLRLGQAARATVERDHTWSGVVTRLLDLAEPPGCGSPARPARQVREGRAQFD